MLDLRPIGYVLGLLTIVMGVAMLFPMALDLSDGNRNWQAFAVSAAVAVALGCSVALASANFDLRQMSVREAFLLTTATWVVLFTHRGLSGPAILQISSYWREGDRIALHLRPDLDPFEHLRARRAEAGGRALSTVLSEMLPKALARHLSEAWGLQGNLADHSDASLRALATRLEGWTLAPTSSEGYRTAEVTLGGVATDKISSRSMESQLVPRLHVIGEALDVTGWLGGYNFQWAWASGVAAGRSIAANSV